MKEHAEKIALILSKIYENYGKPIYLLHLSITIIIFDLFQAEWNWHPFKKNQVNNIWSASDYNFFSISAIWRGDFKASNKTYSSIYVEFCLLYNVLDVCETAKTEMSFYTFPWKKGKNLKQKQRRCLEHFFTMNRDWTKVFKIEYSNFLIYFYLFDNINEHICKN